MAAGDVRRLLAFVAVLLLALTGGLSQTAHAHDRVPPGHCCPICGKICGCPLTVPCGDELKREDRCIKTTMADVIRDTPRGPGGERFRNRRKSTPQESSFESANSGKAQGREAGGPANSAPEQGEVENTRLPPPPSTVDFGAPTTPPPQPGKRLDNQQLVLPSLLVDPSGRESRPLLFR